MLTAAAKAIMERKYAGSAAQTEGARGRAAAWVKAQNESFEQTAEGRQLLDDLKPEFAELKDILKRIDET